MSNFKCEKCGRDILEGEGGNYYTECEHYPLDPIIKKKYKDIIQYYRDVFNNSSKDKKNGE